MKESWVRERVRVAWVLLVCSATLCAVAGCRTTNEDLRQWASTVRGPVKLIAVLTHDKYPVPLRVEAALTLVRMRPRHGQRVGIDLLVDALLKLPAVTRSQIVAGMVPELCKKIEAPPPQPNAAGAGVADESVAYKDAAFAMLTSDGGSVVASAEHRDALHRSLARWAATDFSARFDDASQKYGMSQVLRELGPDGVRQLPALITADAPKVDRIAQLVADIGDEETKVRASEQLVAIAKDVVSAAWTTRRTEPLKKANEQSGLKVSQQQLEQQLLQYQDEELFRTFDWMRKVGQAPVVDYLTAFALDKGNSDKRRAAALAGLQGHLNLKNPAVLGPFLDLVGAEDTPDVVRQLALARVGEAPRKLVVRQLYALFRHERWKIRWVAAELVLKMSTVEHLEEFMQELKEVRHMSLSEATLYGRMISELDGSPAVATLIDAYAASDRKAPERVTALGYYYSVGTNAQLSKIEALGGTLQKVPGCKDDGDQCEWKCTVSGLARDVSTIGDFIQYCVKPAMEQRGQIGASQKTQAEQ